MASRAPRSAPRCSSRGLSRSQQDCIIGVHTDIDHVGETLPRGEELSPTQAVLREREQLAERAVRSHGGLRGALEATEEP